MAVTEVPFEAATVGYVERSPKANRRRRRRFPWYAYLALAPLMVVLGWFAYYPAASGIFFSFFDWNPASVSEFIGLENYATMLDDKIWWKSFGNLGIIFLFGIASWIFPLLAAELLITLRSARAQYVFRTLLIIPMAFPGVVTALVWSFMYQPNNGLINTTLESLGLGFLASNWVGDPDTALLALLFIGFPWIAGLPFLLIYTSLQNVPPEIFEAAEIDGVGRIRRFWTIDLPLMATQAKILVFLAVVSTLQYGFMAFIVTGGGPDNATMVPVLRMLNVAFQGGDWGYAAALSTTLFFITLFFSVIIVFFRRKKTESTSDAKGM